MKLMDSMMIMMVVECGAAFVLDVRARGFCNNLAR